MYNDLTDKTFGMLTAIKVVGVAKNRTLIWRCSCECGQVVDVRSDALRSGHTKSCGCYRNLLKKVENVSGKILVDKDTQTLQEQLDKANAQLEEQARLIAQLSGSLMAAEEEMDNLGEFIEYLLMS